MKKKIHIVSICGVATSAMAIAFQKAGWEVSGSDKGFFPPVSTELEKYPIRFYAGWHPEKMIEGGKPDLISIGTSSGTQNPEVTYAKENGIPVFGYTEVFRDYFIRKNSVVVVGTWGKTTSTALLANIFESAEKNPSYMFGGISLSHGNPARISESDWSIFEGDEYKSGPDNPLAKFFYYNPTHLLMTGLAWDHADLYPTEELYLDAFRKLIAELPANGKVVACLDNELLVKTLSEKNTPFVSYGKNQSAEYVYSNVSGTLDGISFDISVRGKTYHIESPLLGNHMAENITGAFALASECGIPTETILSSVKDFKGIKRRLEKRLSGSITIIDDLGHSSEKARNVLRSLRPLVTGKIIAIFEPNIGGRKPESAHQYDGAFSDADTVIIPRLSKLKIDPTKPITDFDAPELAATIQKTHKNTLLIEDDEKLVSHLRETAKPGDAIIFLGSHGFRNMIDETVKVFEK